MIRYLPEVNDVSRSSVIFKGVLDDVRVASEELSVDFFVERDEIEILNAKDFFLSVTII